MGKRGPMVSTLRQISLPKVEKLVRFLRGPGPCMSLCSVVKILVAILFMVTFHVFLDEDCGPILRELFPFPPRINPLGISYSLFVP